MGANIPYALNNCENDIYFIGGKEQERIEEIIEEYKEQKSEITSIILDQTKKLPHYENANTTLKEIEKYLSTLPDTENEINS